MKNVKQWCDAHPGTVLLICALLGIPVALWLSRVLYHNLDEPWLVTRHNAAGCLCFTVALSVWLVFCHVALCLYNRVSPLTYFLNHFKQQ